MFVKNVLCCLYFLVLLLLTILISQPLKACVLIVEICITKTTRKCNTLCCSNWDVWRRWVLKGRKGEHDKINDTFPAALLISLSSCPSFLSAPPFRHSIAPRLLFLFSSSLCIDFSLPLLSFLLFLTYFGIVCIQTLDKRGHKKRDRWRDESRRSRRQMEGEREDGRRRKEQSLLFLAAGPSYFILLYNWYSFYITITVAPRHKT